MHVQVFYNFANLKPWFKDAVFYAKNPHPY